MPIRIEFQSSVADYKGVFSTPPTNPVDGDRYIDSDDDTMYVYYGGTWQALHVLTPAAPAPMLEGVPYGLLLLLTIPEDGGG